MQIEPIDACHILLVRPWLYDNHTIHHNRANNNSFQKSNKNYTLHPLKEEVTNCSKFSKVFYLLRINSVMLMASCHSKVWSWDTYGTYVCLSFQSLKKSPALDFDDDLFEIQ